MEIDIYHKDAIAHTYPTCSITRSVLPFSSSQCPRKSSPRKGLKGFLPPSLSFLPIIRGKVLRNHWRTSKARCSGSLPRVGETKSDGRSSHVPENSMMDIGDSKNGGAVMVDKSPLKFVMDFLLYQYEEERSERVERAESNSSLLSTQGDWFFSA